MMPAPADPVRVVLAEDHDLIRAGIAALLAQIPGVQVIAEARDGHELLALLQGRLPDVVITDIGMPGLDGLAATRRIRETHPEVRVIALSMQATAEAVKEAVASGACGYLRKDAPRVELELAIRSVMARGSYFGHGVAQLLLRRGETPVEEILTERQLQVLKMVAQGRTSKEIAFELGLSAKTVAIHRANIMERLQLTDVASLTLYAVRKGLVKP